MFVFKTIISFLKDKEYRQLLITTFFIISGGSITYHFLEGWSWIDSIYFSFVTLTTVGFGDFAPQTDERKLFTILYIILGVGMILSFINAIYEHYRKQRHKKVK
ncbi:potassium channel family protein [Bacteroidia bacterium]|nr:potassium channel family protein [Bacteroidia bacterium]